MRSNLSHLTVYVTLTALMAGCATTPPDSRQPRGVAHIVSGDVVSYGTRGFGTEISIIDVDGRPVAEPYGPVEIQPGKHTVTLKCDGTQKASTLTFAAGEVYQFVKVSSPGVKGCTGALSRVRTTNP